MALVAGNTSEILLLKYILNHTSPTNVEMRLYSNNRTPVESDAFGNYTQVTTSGYTAVKLTGSNWSVANSLGTTTGEHTAHTFSFTTSSTVYGYYVTNDANNALLWAERFTGAPFSIPGGGGTIQVTPKITLE